MSKQDLSDKLVGPKNECPPKLTKLFFEREREFQLMALLLMIIFYHQTKTPISFWYRRGLNLRSLIQPLETLPVELIGTHLRHYILIVFKMQHDEEIN